eukprot:CAMPEP_0167753462 /NCGR_PEP_ID=MMETSP0110_2-20121227/7728_1 /TAXON_ID=629695 /ORGANISM="Gymnochlora sp., Strain CCMP2014" /LENGTH=218 /DNA_ID=CAMNT_0007639233 /DNA_START=1211 /DNA_END=1867 /DNA_ORIENTATION=+
MTAARENKTRALDFLLKDASSDDINRQQKDGFTALHFACWKGSVQSARSLLEQGANPTLYDTYGITSLHKAVAFNQLQILREMFRKSRLESLGVTKEHLANLPTGEVSCPEDYQAVAMIDSPMHIAARHGSVHIMEYLISQGAHPALRNRKGDTPLHCAVRQRRLNAVDFLLKQEGETKIPLVNLLNNDGKMPIQVCIGRDFDCLSAKLKIFLSGFRT